MHAFKSISAITAICVAGIMAGSGAATAADVDTGDLLVVCNTKGYGHQGVWSYKYDEGTGQYLKSSEQLFIDLQAYGDGTITDITYGPDRNLYVAISASNVVKRYDGRTGAFIDDYITHTAGLRNVTFSPSGKAYVNSGVEVYERQSNGSLAAYVTAPAPATSIYRIDWGPDQTSDGKEDLYVAPNPWNKGIYAFGFQGHAGSWIMSSGAGGYGVYECFCLGPDAAMTYLYAISQYKSGQPVAYHSVATGAYLGSFTGNVGAYAGDMAWGPDGKLHLTTYSNGKVVVYDNAGAFDYDFWVTESWGYVNKAYALEFVPPPPRGTVVVIE